MSGLAESSAVQSFGRPRATARGVDVRDDISHGDSLGATAGTGDHPTDALTDASYSAVARHTHDAWNRLVKVVAGSATVLEQQYAASIGGLSWRTWKRSDTNANGTLDEERTFAYDPSWRLVEERVDADYPTRPGLDRRVQHVWGKRYIDDAVLHRRDGNNDGDYLDANEGTWYHLTDAMYSTVALFSGASVVERVTYTPYGEARHHFGNDVTGDGGTDASDQAIVLGAWGTTIGNAGYLAEADLNRDGSIGSADLSIVLSYATALAPGLISNASPTGPDSTIGWDGYVFNPETRLYTVRHRSYLPVLGRWMERDPVRHLDGGSLLEYSRGRPITASDPLGLCVGSGISRRASLGGFGVESGGAALAAAADLEFALGYCGTQCGRRYPSSLEERMACNAAYAQTHTRGIRCHGFCLRNESNPVRDACMVGCALPYRSPSYNWKRDRPFPWGRGFELD